MSEHERRQAITPDDIDRIAEVLIEKIHARKHDFWIDPEQHYQDHQKYKDKTLNNEDHSDLKQLINLYRTTRGWLFKSFIGMAVIGAVALAGYSALREIFK